MKSKQQAIISDDQPVAYDADGQSLYHRPGPAPNPEPQAVIVEDDEALPPDLQTLHDESVRNYPDIQFSKTEYVVIDVQRTIWGLIFIWLTAVAAFAVVLLFAAMMLATTDIEPYIIFTIVVAMGVISLVGGWAGQYVFRQNTFIVTNERALAHVQTTPFSFRSQNIEIEHVEDCSYRQSGPIQMLLGFGSIKLSTFGDEHTYNFSFVTQPAEQFKVINRVVQAVDEEAPTKYRP